MEQYIKKAALVAEIKRRIKEHHSGYLVCLKDMLSILDTFEVKNIRDIWHTITETDLPNMGEVICVVKNGRIISGEYRANKFYGKVCNGYDNPIEKGDKWCYLSDIILDTLEVKEVDLEKVSLTWKDINLIDYLLFDIKEDYDNGKLDKEKYYKEVLKKFKAQL